SSHRCTRQYTEWYHCFLSRLFFFFQAEDGIRDRNVTGVQTCSSDLLGTRRGVNDPARSRGISSSTGPNSACTVFGVVPLRELARSEERRVGKEGGCGWEREGERGVSGERGERINEKVHVECREGGCE